MARHVYSEPFIVKQDLQDRSVLNLPFALSIGPQRTGAGWIERYLRFRGDVCLPSGVKETFFFDRHNGRGAAFYRNHFSIQPGHKLAMEVTTTVFDHAEAPLRVHGFFGPDIRLICPLRHPVERAFSQYLHLQRYGIVRGGLADAVEQAPQILNGSRYAQHLERWYRYFAPERVTLLFQEELENDQAQYVRQLCEALGLDYLAPPESFEGGYNVTDVARFPGLSRVFARLEDRLLSAGLVWPVRLARRLDLRRLLFGPEIFDAQRVRMSREDHEWLSIRLVPEIERFEALLGRPVMAWRRGVQLS